MSERKGPNVSRNAVETHRKYHTTEATIIREMGLGPYDARIPCASNSNAPRQLRWVSLKSGLQIPTQDARYRLVTFFASAVTNDCTAALTSPAEAASTLLTLAPDPWPPTTTKRTSGNVGACTATAATCDGPTAKMTPH